MPEPSKVLEAHDKYGLPLAYTRNNKALATGGFDGTVRVWSTQHWQETVALAGHAQSVNCGTFVGPLLVTGSTDTTLHVWDLTEEDPRTVLHGHKKTVTSVCGHPRRPLVASASYDTTVRVWDLDEEDEIALLKGHTKNVTTVRFLDDRRLVSGGLGGELIFWDLEDGEETGRAVADPTAVVAVARGAAGALWSAGHGGTLRQWDPDGTERATYALPDGVRPTGLAVEPEKGRVAVTRDHGVHMFDTEGRLLETHELKPKGVYAPRFSPDGRHLAVGGADGKVRIFS